MATPSRAPVVVGPVWGLGLVVALVVSAPMAAAAMGTASRTIVAPYKGAVVSPSDGWSYQGCAQATNVKLAFFHPSTGLGGLYDSAAARGCPHPPKGVTSTSSGGAGGQLIVGLPLVVYRGGPHVIAVHWAVTVAGFQALKVGNCVRGTGAYTLCIGWSDVTVSGYAFLTDTTNGSWFYSHSWTGWGSWTQREAFYYNGSWNNSTSGHPGAFLTTIHPTFWINGSLNASDRYTLSLGLYGNAYAEVSGFSWGKAGASLNMATLGNRADLTSITIS